MKRMLLSWSGFSRGMLVFLTTDFTDYTDSSLTEWACAWPPGCLFFAHEGHGCSRIFCQRILRIARIYFVEPQLASRMDASNATHENLWNPRNLWLKNKIKTTDFTEMTRILLSRSGFVSHGNANYVACRGRRRTQRRTCCVCACPPDGYASVASGVLFPSAGNEYKHLLMRDHRDVDIPNSIPKDEDILRDGFLGLEGRRGMIGLEATTLTCFTAYSHIDWVRYSETTGSPIINCKVICSAIRIAWLLSADR